MGEIASNLTTTIKFVYEGTPAPEPTPIHFDFDFDFSSFSFLSRFGLSPFGYGSVSTGDGILTLIMLFLFLLLIGAGIYVLAKKRMNANGYSENTKVARVFSLIHKYDKKIKFAFCALVVALSSVLLVNAFLGRQAVTVANADSFNADVKDFNVYTPEELICHVKDDGKTKSFELDDAGYYIQNNEEWVTANFSYAIVESDFGPWDNVNWQIKCDGKEIYNQPANIPMKDNKAFSIDLKHGERKSLSIQPVGDGATWDWAYSLCGLDALRVTYVATPNLIKALGLPEGMTPENATGMLERSFADSPWDVKRATGVEFNLIEGDQTLDDYVAQHARKYQVYNEEQEKYEEVPYVVDLSEAQNKTILAIITDDPLTNSYKAQVISKSVIYANTDSLSYLFRNFNSLYHIDFDNLDLSFAQDASYMFSGTGRDDGAMMTLKLNANSKGDTLTFPEGLNANYMFAGCNASIDLSNVVFQKGTQMDYFFKDFGTGIIKDTTPPEKTRPLQMTLSTEEKGFKIPEDSSSYRMFEGLSVDLTPSDVVYPNRPLDQIDTSNANNLIGMFANYCQNKDNITLDLTHMDINTEGDDMTQMFEGCFAGGKNDTIIFPKDEEGKFKLAKNVTSMFQNCDMEELDMSEFDFSQVNNMSHFLDSFCRNQVFTFEAGKSPIIWPSKDDFKTAENCDASYMYANTSMYPDVIGLWDPSKITSMKGFFSNYMRGLVGPIHQPDGAEDPVTINLKTLAEIETGPYVFATGCDLSEMFKFAYCNVDMSEVNVSGVTNFANMFEMFGAVSAVDGGMAENVCTLKLGSEGETNQFIPAANADFSHMFDLAQLSEIDLTNVDLSKVHKFSYMFSNVGQFISLDIKQPTDIAPTALSAISPFYCQINFPDTFVPYVDEVKGEGAQMDYMFSNFNWDASLINTSAEDKYYIDLSKLDTSKVQNFEGMFSKFNSHPLSGIKQAGEDDTAETLQYRKNVVLPTTFSTYDNANMSHMFEHSNAYTSLQPIDGDPQYMFVVDLDVSKFDTSKVVNMSYMFAYMWLLPIGPISSDIEQITTSWQEMLKLEVCKFTLDVSNFDVSKVTDMSYMFSYTFYRHPGLSMVGFKTDFSGDLKLFELKKPEGFALLDNAVACKAEHLFDGCGVPEINLTNTDLYNATDLSNAFANLGFEGSPCHIIGLSELKVGQNSDGCKLVSLFDRSYLYFDDQGYEPGNVKLDLTGWDISKTTDLSYLFYRAQVDELDISNWNPASCTNMEGMFQEFGNDNTVLVGESTVQKSVIKFPNGEKKDDKENPIYWTTGENCSMKNMFSMCLADVDLSYFKVDKVTNMEGMFLSYGTAYKQVENIVKRYILQLLGESDSNADNFVGLLVNNIDNLFDESVSELSSDVAASTSLVDAYTAKAQIAFNYLDASSKVPVKENVYGFNADAINSGSAVNLSSILPSSGLTTSAYKTKYVNELNEDAEIQKAQLRAAILETVSESAEDDKLMEILDTAVAEANEAQSNLMLNDCKVTFPTTENSFNPASSKDEYKCSMKEMFALFNVLNLNKAANNGGIQEFVPNFAGFNTSKVNDMSYMFAGFMLNDPSEWIVKPVEETTSVDPIVFDISTFDTSKVESMKMMFAFSGLYCTRQSNSNGNTSPYLVSWKLGDSFRVAMHKEYDEVLHTNVDVPCDVSFMFAACCVDRIDGLNKIIGLSENGTTSTKTMFAFSDIINLDISEWDASKITDLSFMFAFYGMPTTILSINVFKDMEFIRSIKIGTDGTDKPKFTLAKDAVVNGMFVFPAVDKIDLRNMNVSNATSLEKMFEFCITPYTLLSLGQMSISKIDISSWNPSSVTNFKSMFAYSIFEELLLPENKLKTGELADMTGMFKYCSCGSHLEDPESNEKVPYYFDVSKIDLSKVSSTKQMFAGFNLLLQFMGSNTGDFEKSYISFGEQKMDKCLDMSEMFELSPMGIDMSKVSSNNSLKNLDKMFAFSGYRYLDFYNKKSKNSNAGTSISLLANFMKFKTDIKFPDKEAGYYLKPASGSSMNHMFAGTNMGNLDLEPIATTEDTYWNKAKDIDISFVDTSNVASMEGLFMLLVSPLDLTTLNISSVTNMKFFFTGYGFLAMSFEANLDTSEPEPGPEPPEQVEFNVEIKITDLPKVQFPTDRKLVFNKDCRADYMFTLYGAGTDQDPETEAQYYDLNMFDTSKLQQFDYMFAYSLGLFNFDISSWNLGSTTSLNHVFQGYGYLFSTIYDFIIVQGNSFKIDEDLKLPVPYIDSLMNTKEFSFPYLPEGSENKFSTVGMFEFASIFKCYSSDPTPVPTPEPTPVPVVMYKLTMDKTFDISDWEFSRINDASYMFAGYGISPYSLVFNGFYIGFLIAGSLGANDELLTGLQENYMLSKLKYPEIILSKSENANEWSFAEDAKLEGMFAFCDANVHITGLDFSKVMSVSHMFAGYAISYDQRFENTRLKVDLLENKEEMKFSEKGCEARYMFAAYNPDKLDLTNMDVSNMTDLTGMFALSTTKGLNISNWNTEKVTSFMATFAGAQTNVVDISKWKFTSAKDISYMFAAFGSLTSSSFVRLPDTLGIEKKEGEEGCNASYMFYASNLDSIILRGFTNDVVSNLSNVDYMFNSCAKLKSINVRSDSDWRGKWLSGTYMFEGCTNLTGSNGTKYKDYHTNIDYAVYDNEDHQGYFTASHELREPYELKDNPEAEDSDLTSIFIGYDDDYKGFTVEQLNTVEKVVFKQEDRTAIEGDVDLSAANDGSVIAYIDSSSKTLYVCAKESVYSESKSFVNMFNWNKNKGDAESALKAIEFGDGVINTVSATSMYGTFSNCTKLSEPLNLYKLNTANVVNMSYMFSNIGSASQHVSLVFNKDGDSFSTGSVDDMSYMFDNAYVYSGMDNSVENNLDLTKFSASYVRSMDHMFNSYNGTPINFPTAYASFAPYYECDYTNMFTDVNLKYLDLSGFLVPSGSTVLHMFCYSEGSEEQPLSAIYVAEDRDEATNWTLTKDVEPSGLETETFVNCTNLPHPDKTSYKYCHPDGYGSEVDKSGNFYDSVTVNDNQYKQEALTGFDKMLADHNNKLSGKSGLSLNEIRIDKKTNFSDYSKNNIIAYTQCEDRPISIYSALVSPSLYDTVIVSADHILFTGEGFADLIPRITKNGITSDSSLKQVSSVSMRIKEHTSSGESSSTPDVSGMFQGAESLTKFDIKEISYDWEYNDFDFYAENYESMFEGCKSLRTIDSSLFKTWFMQNTKNMFKDCSSLKTIEAEDQSTNWSSAEKLTESADMFAGCTSLVGGTSFKYKEEGQAHDKTFAKTCPAQGEEKTGFFTYGAILRSTSTDLFDLDDVYSESLTDYIMTRYFGGAEEPDEELRLVYSSLGLNRKQFVRSLKFYKNFELSDDYSQYQLGNSNGKKISIKSGYSESDTNQRGLYAYVYSGDYDNLSIPGLNTNIPLYRIAISTCGYKHYDSQTQQWITDEYDTPIIAQEDSLIKMCQGLKFLGYYNEHEESKEERSVDFFADRDKLYAQGIDNVLDISAVNDMSSMFEDSFSDSLGSEYQVDSDVKVYETLDLTGLDTSNVEVFDNMFKNCKARLLKLSTITENSTNDPQEEETKFSVVNAKSMNGMFSGFGRVDIVEKDVPIKIGDAAPQLGIGLIDCPSAIKFPANFGSKFADCDGRNMFSFAHMINLDVSNINFTNFRNMDNMFAYAGGFRLVTQMPSSDDDHLDFGVVNNEEDFNYAISLAKSLEACDAEATNNILQTSFKAGKSISDFGNGFAGEITFPDTWGPGIDGATTNGMFKGLMMSNSGTQNMDTSKVVSMNEMFANTVFTKYIYTGNSTLGSTSWETSNVESMQNMFAWCGRIDGTSLIGNYVAPEEGKEAVPDGKLHFKFVNGCNVAEMFRGAHIPVDLSATTDTSGSDYGLNVIDDYYGMFADYALYALPTLKGVGLSEDTPLIGTFGHPENMVITFRDKSKEEVWTPPSGSSMNEMFRNCKVPVDLSVLDTKSVVSYQYMFQDYGKRNEVDIAYKYGIDYAREQIKQKAPEYLELFDKYVKLLDGVEIYGTPGEEQPEGTFNLCLWPLPNVEFKKLDTSQIKDVTMKGMFMGFYGDQLDLKAEWFDTTNVVDMSEMFCGCKMEKIDLSGFNTKNVRDMSYMFESETLRPFMSWQIKLGENFTLDNVVDMSYMFGSLVDENSELRQIVVPNETNWTKYISDENAKGRIIFTDNMFLGAVKLVGNITAENHDHVTIYNSDIVDGFNSSYVQGAVGGYARLGYLDETTGKWAHGYFTSDSPLTEIPEDLVAEDDNAAAEEPKVEEAPKTEEIVVPEADQPAEEVIPAESDKESAVDLIREVVENDTLVLSILFLVPTNVSLVTSLLSLFTWI